ncbi:MAG: hypothetical protein JRJ60_15325 [Deltaproteobacteria bacterium]|nr:hypothetical protein [Deltaproteobacteria bacterium]
MGLKIWVVNIMLAGVAVVFGIKAYAVWSEEARNAPESPSEGKSSALPAKKVVRRDVPKERSLSIIAKNNLFSPERKEIEPEQEKSTAKPEPEKQKEEEKPRELKAGKKKMFLYGVLMAEGCEAALITNPNWKTEKKQQAWVRVGDTVEGFKVATIEKERIVLTADGNEVEMFLYDKEKPRSKAPVRKARKRVSRTKGKKDASKSVSKRSSRADRSRAAAMRDKKGTLPKSTGRQDPRRKSLKDRINERNKLEKPPGFGKFHGKL